MHKGPTYCRIGQGQVWTDDTLAFESEEEDRAAFMKAGYKHLGISYPKFFKMDDLSKLAFLAAEFLSRQVTIDSDTGLVFSNRASSLDTDRKYQASINDSDNFFPSPAVFVYTLPNICIGEISIRHQLQSENCFFIFDSFAPVELNSYAASLISSDKTDQVMCAWVDVDKDSYEAMAYVIRRDDDPEHLASELMRIYKEYD